MSKESFAVSMYAMDAYKLINTCLRDGSIMEDSYEWERLLAYDISAYIKANAINGHVTVYRWSSPDIFGGSLETVKVGDVFHDDGFLSTSKDPTLFHNGAHAVKFVMELGSNISFADISKFGNENEQEVLVDRGANICIDAVDGNTVYCRVISQTATAFTRPEGWDD